MALNKTSDCRPRSSKGHFTCDNLKNPVTVHLPDASSPNSFGDLIFIKKYPNKQHPLVFLSKSYKVNNSDMVILGNDTKTLYITAIFDGSSWVLDEIVVNRGEKLSSVIQRKKSVDEKRNDYISKESNKYRDNIGGIPKIDYNADGKLKVSKKGKVKTTKMEGGGKAVMLNFDENEKKYDRDMVLDLSDDTVSYEKPKSHSKRNVGENQGGNDLLNRRPKHPTLIYEGDRVIITNDNFNDVPPKMPPVDKGFHIDDDDDEDDETSFVARRKVNQKAYDSLYEGFHVRDDMDSD